MRTLTSTQLGVFDAVKRGSLPSVYTKVEIDQTGSGSWINMSSLYGRDYVNSISITRDRNQQVSTATVNVALDYDGSAARSLSPKQASSLANTSGVLCAADRKIRIYTATVPNGYGAPPSASSLWVKVFEGRITQPTVNGDSISLDCRDKGGELQDTWIEKIKTYGSAAGTDVEDVMQAILDAWNRTATTLYSAAGTSGTPFNAGDSPGFGILPYQQQRMPILQALQILADQIGYRIAYRYHEGSGINDFVLVLEEPDRAVSSTVWTVPKAAIQDMTLSEDITMVRNVIVGIYSNYDNGGARTARIATDSTSITAYGRRLMIVSEASTSQIDTQTEMDAMLTALITDLKDSHITVSARIPYAYHLEVNDYLQLEADNRILGSAFDVAIDSITDNIDASGAWSQLTLRGKPTSGERRHAWKEAFDRVGSTNGADLGDGIFGVPGTTSVIANGDFADWGRG